MPKAPTALLVAPRSATAIAATHNVMTLPTNSNLAASHLLAAIPCANKHPQNRISQVETNLDDQQTARKIYASVLAANRKVWAKGIVNDVAEGRVNATLIPKPTDCGSTIQRF
jgi:hypothetical protein